jgi:hypothetical protein
MDIRKYLTRTGSQAKPEIEEEKSDEEVSAFAEPSEATSQSYISTNLIHLVQTTLADINISKNMKQDYEVLMAAAKRNLKEDQASFPVMDPRDSLKDTVQSMLAPRRVQ